MRRRSRHCAGERPVSDSVGMFAATGMGSDFDARATVGCQSAGAPTVRSAGLQFAAPADAARGLPNRPAAMRSRGRVSRGRVQPGPKPVRPPPVATARALPLPSAFRRRAKGLPHLATEMVPRRPRLRGWVPRNRQAGPTAPEPAQIGEHIGRAVSDALLSRSARRRRSREATRSRLCVDALKPQPAWRASHGAWWTPARPSRCRCNGPAGRLLPSLKAQFR